MIRKLEYGNVEMGGPRHLYREVLMISFLRQAMTKGLILDAGCGDGSLSIALAKHGFKVRSIDLADGFVAMLKEKAINAHLNDSIDCKQGDITKVEFPDNTFDGIVCGEVLEHVLDDKRALSEFNRVLKKGGICVITVPVNPKLWDISDVVARHVKRYTKKELISLFQDNGFRVEKIHFWGIPLMWLYHKTIFLFWVKMMKRKNDYERDKNTFTKIGKNSLVSLLIANIFKIDNLFSWLPWGIGVVLRARKVKDLSVFAENHGCKSLG